MCVLESAMHGGHGLFDACKYFDLQLDGWGSSPNFPDNLIAYLLRSRDPEVVWLLNLPHREDG